MKKLLLLPLLALAVSCTPKTTTSTLLPEVEKPIIVSAVEWGSSPDPIPEEQRHVPTYITLHHAGMEWKEGSEPVAKLKGLQAYGKNEKDWPDLPYHFLIAPDGETFEGRSVLYSPETNTSYDTTGHIGINVWGNFEVQRISYQQLVSTVDTAAWLCSIYNIDPATIKGHLDVAPGQTVCPGKDFYRYIEQGLIAQWVQERMEGKFPDIQSLPAMEGGPTEVIPGGSL
jgi:N-acetylmuramoyl-L-alanine amidase